MDRWRVGGGQRLYGGQLRIGIGIGIGGRRELHMILHGGGGGRLALVKLYPADARCAPVPVPAEGRMAGEVGGECGKLVGMPMSRPSTGGGGACGGVDDSGFAFGL